MPARPLLAALVLMTSGGSPLPQTSLLQQLIERGRHPAIRWARFSDVQAEARALYLKNGWTPLWIVEGRPTAAARALVDALATAFDRGLNPQDYDAAQLGALGAMLDRRGADAEQATRFDTALTIAALRFVEALAHGRVAPRQANQAPFDAAATVQQLRETTAPGPVLTALEPPWSPYHLLKRALVRYRALVRDSVLLRLERPGKSALREGDRYLGAARLRRLLAELGDLNPHAAGPRAGDSVLTTELADGIRRFQVRQGERVDGQLSEATWRLLTTHLSRRIAQMALALERWRWLPRELAGPPLFVSLPAMRLHFDSPPGGQELSLINMSVRLGDAFQQERAVQAGMLSRVVLHPDWGRPDGLEALGDIRLVLPADSNLYLHGTSLSSPAGPSPGSPAGGCIRVADAELLAELLLRDGPDWPPGRIRAARTGSKPVFVRLRRSVPVLVVYSTAVARENGQVFFYPDRFGHDRRLEQQLAAGYPFPR